MSAIQLPGLIDPHVHLRDLGQEEKEDFYTGTAAALAGGFTTVLDMPNNLEPITTVDRLKRKVQNAKSKIVCDLGFYFGTQGDNFDEFAKLNREEGSRVFGLKVYMNQTTGNFLFDRNLLTKLFESWTHNAPILFHAEGETLLTVLDVAKQNPKPIHICHVSNKQELKFVLDAKERGLPVTCGVAPHHLFLNENDKPILGPFGVMKPPLGTNEDQKFLWQNLNLVDVIESDHAPHSLEEKQAEPIPFGVPGLETTLPLLLTAVNDSRLTIDDIIRLCHDGPSRIFGVNDDPETKIVVDLHESYIIKPESFFSRCKWSPFDGWKVKGRVKKVTLHGKTVFENDILADRGSGAIL